MITQAVSIVLFSIGDTGPVFWMSKRFRGNYAGLWQFPGGKVEEGESSAVAAARELKEETGLDEGAIDYFRPRFSNRMHPTKGEFRMTTFTRGMEVNEGLPQWTEPAEQSAWVPFTFYEALQLRVVPGTHEDLMSFFNKHGFKAK